MYALDFLSDLFGLVLQLIISLSLIIKGQCRRRGGLIRSDEGLTLETSAFESLYGG